MTFPMESLVSILTLTFPYRILAYYPFWDRLRFSRLKTILMTAATELGTLAMLCFPNIFHLSERAVETLYLPICGAIYLVCIKVAVTKLVFFYIFVADYIMINRGITLFTLSRFFPQAAGAYTYASAVIHICVLVATLPLILIFWKKTTSRMMEVNAPALWRVIWILPAFTTITVLIFTWDINADHTQSLRFLLARISLLACLFVIYYVLMKSLDTIRQTAVLEQAVEYDRQLLSLQEKQLQQLLVHYEDIRHARHDLRQHLLVMQSYLGSRDYEALSAYIDSFSSRQNLDPPGYFCSHPAANSILSYYAQSAGENGIHFQADAHISAGLPIAETDLCILLGNLLENAVEACNRNLNSQSFIRVCTHVQENHFLIITVDNTLSEEPLLQNGRFLSSKHDGEGLGTHSIRKIAEKYKGTSDFKWKEGVFYASVLVPLN